MKTNMYLLIMLSVIFAASTNAQIAVIANKSVSENSINISRVSDIYSSKTKTWNNGAKIVRFTLKSDEGSAAKFFEGIGKSLSELKKLWMKYQLTGEGQAPESLDSEDEVLNKVAATPGAIGFINAGKVNDKVKVLLIIN